ncbi:MAG: PAS domain S-box protein [Bacteroidales bacterium]
MINSSKLKNNQFVEENTCFTLKSSHYPMQDQLRKEAEKIARTLLKSQNQQKEDLDKIVHELQVHQIELELQNDELRRTSQELELSHKRFTNLFDHAPVGYLELNKDLKIVNTNFAATFMLNSSKEELQDKAITLFIHPDFQDTFYFYTQKVLNSDDLHSVEVKLKNPGKGDYFFTQIQSIRDYDNSDESYRIRTALIDISERKKIEKRLKRFRAAIDSSADNIFLIDYKTGYFIDVNESACKNLGFTRAEFLVLKPEHINPLYTTRYIQQIIAEKNTDQATEGLTLETKHTRKDGTIIDVEVFVRLTEIEDEKIIVAVARDITERKQTQEKLTQYAQELKELNESKDKFLSIISHDLRGPFLGIKGYTQLLIEDYEQLEKDEVMDYLNKIHQSTRDLYTLVDNLLKWSRLELGKIPYEPMSFNLLDELEPIVKLLSGVAAKKEITLKNEIQQDMYPYADRLMLISVVQNLVSNAVKFTPKNGEVKISAYQNNGKIAVKVADTGQGMQPEVLEKLFTLDKSYTSRGTEGEKGTGFGLIIAREMVLKMGGDIWAESEPGKGSVFTFTLQNDSQPQDPS